MNKKGPSMKDDYLWDGSGEPDPEVQKLETLLGRYRHNQPAPAFDQIVDVQPVKRRWSIPSFRLSFQLAGVAAILLIGISALFVLRTRQARNSGPAWEVARLEGSPRIGWHAMGASTGSAKLAVGQTLVTDSSSGPALRWTKPGALKSTRVPGCDWSRAVPGASGSRSSAAPFTPPSGRRPVSLLWIRRRLLPWI